MYVFEKDIAVSDTDKQVFCVLLAIPVIQIGIIRILIASTYRKVDGNILQDKKETGKIFVASVPGGIRPHQVCVRQIIIASEQKPFGGRPVGKGMFHSCHIVGYNIQIVRTTEG